MLTELDERAAERREHAAEALGQDFPTDPEQDWYFTFGHGHFLFSDYAGGQGRHGHRHGIPLLDKYVVIHGTEESARLKMVEIFGGIWSDQHRELPDIGDRTWKRIPL
jgi:hypothetical protein